MFSDLHRLYAPFASPVVRAGRAYPAAIEPAPQDSVAGLVVVESRETPIDAELRRNGQRHLDAVTERASLYDGQIVVLREIDGKLRAGVSTYFEMIATCESLAEEWLAHPHGRELPPLRKRAHAVAHPDPLHSGQGRAAAIAVSVTVTLLRDDVRSLIIGRRSPAVGLDPGMWDVVPSGMIEPPRHGDPVVEAIARELLEELGVDLPEAELNERVRLLGIGYDLLRLRPEICVRLDLEPADFERNEPSLSTGEYMPDESRYVELSREGLSAMWRQMGPRNLTPVSVATLALLEEDLPGG